MTPILSGGPKEPFENILSQIIHTDPFIWEARVKPHLLAFFTHPIIKELIGQSNAPALPPNNPFPNLELQKIQDSLMQLSKAVDALKKAPPSPSNKGTAAPVQAKASKSYLYPTKPPQTPSQQLLEPGPLTPAY